MWIYFQCNSSKRNGFDLVQSAIQQSLLSCGTEVIGSSAITTSVIQSNSRNSIVQNIPCCSSSSNPPPEKKARTNLNSASSCPVVPPLVKLKDHDYPRLNQLVESSLNDRSFECYRLDTSQWVSTVYPIYGQTILNMVVLVIDPTKYHH